MGTIIGRQGLKIKHIQDVSGVRMVAQKEMLPQSTERIVEVQGTPEGIQRAVWEICKCLVDDWQRGTGTVLYNPVVRTQTGASSLGGGSYNSGGRSDYGSPRVMRTGNGADFSNGGVRPFNRRSDSDAAGRGPPTHDENGEEIQTQNISIPADMVGCIIGRAGSKISEIRKTSGARISIAKVSYPASCTTSCFSSMPYKADIMILLRHHTMRLASACSPSWALPRPTSLPCFSCMRTSRQKRCVAASSRTSKLRRIPWYAHMSSALRFVSVSLCVNEVHLIRIWKKFATGTQPDLTCRKAPSLLQEPGTGYHSVHDVGIATSDGQAK